MRVLIASKRRPRAPGRRDGGVQTWVKTVAAELRRQGHETFIADKAVGTRESFDVGIFANAAYTGHFVGLCERTALVSHGIVGDEAPADGFGAVLFTSEEVRDHWHSTGAIVRQPIDLTFWRPGKGVPRYLTRFANRGGLMLAPLVAEQCGLVFHHARNLSPVEARAVLWQSECVLASGRCAIEAMACGVPVVICDERHYQGPLLDLDIEGSMQRNYSGRGGVVPTVENLRQAVHQAISRRTMRKHVEQHHDVAAIVSQLLEAAK